MMARATHKGMTHTDYTHVYDRETSGSLTLPCTRYNHRRVYPDEAPVSLFLGREVKQAFGKQDLRNRELLAFLL